VQIQRLREIAEDMRSYTLKREAVRRGMLNSQEERAWRRALLHLVGVSGIRERGEPGI
jgi:hypothetical protein